jgi:CRP-like cAMP-binding protein
MPSDEPSTLDAAAALARVPWLAGCSAPARALLLRQASVRRYDRQQAVFHRGEALDHLCIVIEGRLEMSVVGADGRRFVAAQVPPGEAVGFIPLVDRRGAIHDARALVPTTMLRLPREAFLAALQADVELLQAVLRLLLERGRRLNEWRAEVTMRPMGARLARLLLGLAQAFGDPEPDGAVGLAISQDDLAAMVGVTRQAVNPEIKALERSGVVELAYRRVIVRDMPALRTLAREGDA